MSVWPYCFINFFVLVFCFVFQNHLTLHPTAIIHVYTATYLHVPEKLIIYTVQDIAHYNWTL